jgi:hypothetical protein
MIRRHLNLIRRNRITIAIKYTRLIVELRFHLACDLITSIQLSPPRELREILDWRDKKVVGEAY